MFLCDYCILRKLKRLKAKRTIKKKKTRTTRLSFIVSVEDYYFNETLLTTTSANLFANYLNYTQNGRNDPPKKVREKSRECHNHKPQPFSDTKRKRKPIKPNKHKSNKRTKSSLLPLFPKRGNRKRVRLTPGPPP